MSIVKAVMAQAAKRTEISRTHLLSIARPLNAYELFPV
jgi:hypothetical protein